MSRNRTHPSARAPLPSESLGSAWSTPYPELEASAEDRPAGEESPIEPNTPQDFRGAAQARPTPV